jgi:NADPH:quinone reductase-like Zn-dependent oxidoreductase
MDLRLLGEEELEGVLTGVGGNVNTAAILRRHVRIQGIYVGSREMFEEMNRAIAQQQLRPVIARSFAFEQARAAYDYLASGAHTGKVVIRR